MTTREVGMSVIEAPAPTTTVADVLEHWLRVIEEWDWRQNQSTSPVGLDVCNPEVEAFCVGASNRRASVDLTGRELSDLGNEAWYRVFPDGHGVSWNDTPGRTKAEVVARVRLAAERAREAEG